MGIRGEMEYGADRGKRRGKAGRRKMGTNEDGIRGKRAEKRRKRR